MLSFLLTAAIAASETPMALCPPCHPEEEPATVLGFLLSLVKSIVSLLVIVFPLYKTFKAWESNRLRACRAMLAYWSAMTLLNALKDVSDELIGGYLNPHIHHLVLAALKIAPLVLGPDKIYDLTVRPFFEQHEAEMDAMVLKGTEKAQELKHKMEPTLDKVKDTIQPVIDNARASVEPTIEQIRDSLRESVDSVKTTLGMEPTADSTAEQTASELSPEEAVRRDEELTVVEDSTSKTGLRQRSARMESSTNNPAGVTAAAENEIELAKQRNVLVEKIVWGHGLSAKNQEYQRQQNEKEVAQERVMADVHSVAEQFNTVPSSLPSLPPTAAADTHSRTTAAPPALPPRPAPTTDAITITNTATTATTATATSAATKPAVSATTLAIHQGNTVPSTSSAVSTVTTATPTTAVFDTRGAAAATSKKTILLDTRSIPSVVETYAADHQKEL